MKWWLLAIPHYLVMSVFLGGGGYAAGQSDDWLWSSGTGLIDLLVLFAGVALLFSARYPRGLFDFVLGLDRWVARVAAYAALMTDAYPPFCLDQGGEEPGAWGAEEPRAVPPANEEAVEAAPPAGRGAGGVVLPVVGSIAALLAFALLVGGCAAVAVDRIQRDDDDFLMSPTDEFSTATHATVSESADVDVDNPDWAAKGFLGTVRVHSESERPVFVGFARESDVVEYLSGVEHTVVTEIGHEPRYSERRGASPESPPGDNTFWAASTVGAGEQTLEWEPEDGSWSVSS